MIPRSDLYELIDILVGDRLRETPQDLGYWLHETHHIGIGSHNLEPGHVATLARIAAAEAYER